MENPRKNPKQIQTDKPKPKNKTSWDEKAIYAVCIITASYFLIRIITLLIFNL